MHPFLMLKYVLYSDTDSLFCSKPLSAQYIGDNIGQFKDEMNGIIIQEAIFIGPKRYGYWFLDSKRNKLEKSVYAGKERNSLSFKRIISMYNNKNKSPL